MQRGRSPSRRRKCAGHQAVPGHEPPPRPLLLPAKFQRPGRWGCQQGFLFTPSSHLMSQRIACLIKPCFAYLSFLSLRKLSRAGRGWRDTCGHPGLQRSPAARGTPSPRTQIVHSTSPWPQKYFAKDKGVQGLPCPVPTVGPVTAPTLPCRQHAIPGLDRKHHQGNQDCILPFPQSQWAVMRKRWREGRKAA